MKYITTVNGDKYEIDIDQEDRITVDSKTYETDVQFLSDSGVLSLLLNITQSRRSLSSERAAGKF